MATVQANAHPGNTDSNGGHYNRSTGTYHYHHGYPAHDHKDLDGDGVEDCPYTFEENPAEPLVLSETPTIPKSETVPAIKSTSAIDGNADAKKQQGLTAKEYFFSCVIVFLFWFVIPSIARKRQEAARYESAQRLYREQVEKYGLHDPSKDTAG